MDIEFNVRIESDLPAVVPEAVSFETGASRGQAEDRSLLVYEHHGDGWGPDDKGSLPCFFEDLILGRPFPLTFATHGVRDLDTVLAIALFLHRDLAICSSTPGFVCAVDLVHRRGFPALSHLDLDVARFLCKLTAFTLEPGLSKTEFSKRLATSIGWIREYLLEGMMPHLGAPPAPVRVLDQGTNGFVLAESTMPLIDGWVYLYREGFLRGVLVDPGKGDRRHVLAARKSRYVEFDLTLAAHLLNEMESVLGEPAAWQTDGLWLASPPNGTLLLVQQVMGVFTHV